MKKNIISHIQYESILHKILPWFIENKEVVAFESGKIIITNNKIKSLIECKIKMISLGVIPTKTVFVSQDELYDILSYFIYINKREVLLKDQDLSLKRSSFTRNLLHNLIDYGIENRLADVHFIVRKKKTLIKRRQHGKLITLLELDGASIGTEMASIAFNVEAHYQQHFTPNNNHNAVIVIDQHNVRIRLASVPCFGGFDCVLRFLFFGQDKFKDLSGLGYDKNQIDTLTDVMAISSGLLLFSGPTGCGKSTSLYSLMNSVPTTRKIYTIEDPVEFNILNATQISVNSQHNMNAFEDNLTYLLRMDPDIFLVGEIRTKNTADMIFHAMNSGHLVLSTIHAQNSLNVFNRFDDFNISIDYINNLGNKICLVSQRLVPRINLDVAIKLTDSPRHMKYRKTWEKLLKKDLDEIRVVPEKLLHKPLEAYIGVTLIGEVLFIDNNEIDIIRNGGLLGLREELKKRRWSNLTIKAIEVVENKLCDPLDSQVFEVLKMYNL